AHVGPASPPALLIHGLADELVPPGQTELLAAAYRAAGVEVEVELVPHGNHCLLGIPLEPYYDQTVSFLARHLGGDRPPH
ncbi:MAG: prolyl oligopeptidase family serine peptidase, partial [Nocardioides sp.]|uniref:alpha/beta hydrolase family protein n=1 Tax=Nocardioides sp. TaxID=35761 RepID=UPI0039E42EAD